MSLSRAAFAALLAAVLAAPVLLPLCDVARSPDGWAAWRERDRLAALAGNTAGLAALTGALALPVGCVLAVAVERFPVRGRRVLRALVVVGVFVPLPVWAVAWQAVLGGWLPRTVLQPGAVAWRAWNQGLLPAAWVHAMAAVPWVAWVVSAGLRRTDAVLEDDAAVDGGAWAVLRRVVRPRATPAALAALAWVGVQTVTEIPVTDAMMVRTFAEEVYTQMVGGGTGLPVVLARPAAATAVAIPAWLVGVLLAGVFALVGSRRWRPSADLTVARPLAVRPWAVGAATAAAWLIAAVFALLPLSALVLKACGLSGSSGPRFETLAAELVKVSRTDGVTLLTSAAAAAVVGLLTATAARFACWQAARSRWFAAFLFALCVVLFLTPGPLVGLCLLDSIQQLLGVEERVLHGLHWEPTFPPVRSALYDQPSPLPVMWAHAIRLFPVACVVLWPSVRGVPRELTEAARLDGYGAWGEWRLAFAPLTRSATVRAAVAVAALAVGEVSACKLVNPAGHSVYVLRLLDQMHYGAESTVAALCLLQIAVTSAFALLLPTADPPPRG